MKKNDNNNKRLYIIIISIVIIAILILLFLIIKSNVKKDSKEKTIFDTAYENIKFSEILIRLPNLTFYNHK